VTPGTLPEQPRILLVSVPYALKAGDAETLVGKPVCDFVLAQQLKEQVGDGSRAAGEEAARQGRAQLGDRVEPRAHGDGDEPGANELHPPECDERRLRDRDAKRHRVGPKRSGELQQRSPAGAAV
jgi:hypothetical protein